MMFHLSDAAGGIQPHDSTVVDRVETFEIEYKHLWVDGWRAGQLVFRLPASSVRPLDEEACAWWAERCIVEVCG